jgi:hypothetical protein
LSGEKRNGGRGFHSGTRDNFVLQILADSLSLLILFIGTQIRALPLAVDSGDSTSFRRLFAWNVDASDCLVAAPELKPR